jgi:hypothetical protein
VDTAGESSIRSGSVPVTSLSHTPVLLGLIREKASARNTVESKAPSPTAPAIADPINSLYNDPGAKVTLKANDGMVFRMHDYELRASRSAHTAGITRSD